MANVFKTQTLFDKELLFQFDAMSGFDKYVDWSFGSKFSATNRTGATYNFRRPSKIAGSDVGVGNNYDLPSYVAGSYQPITEPTVPLAINHKFETNIQASMEDLVFRIDRNEVMDQHIIPAITVLQDKINAAIVLDVAKYAGMSIGTPGAIDTGANYVSRIALAKQVLGQRGVSDIAKRVALIQPAIEPVLVPYQATLFHANADASDWAEGSIGKYSKFEFFPVPTLPTPSVPASYGTSGTYTFPTQPTYQGDAVAWPLTQWVQTFTVTVAGLGASTTIPAGTKISFTGIYWTVPNTNVSTGITATFTLVQDAVLTSGGGTLVLSEPLIGPAGGGYQNVTAVPVSGTNALNILGSGASTTTTYPSFLMAKGAIIGASPEVAVPAGTPFSAKYNRNGIRFALIQDRWPGSLQTITKLVAFYGVATVRPESIVTMY